MEQVCLGPSGIVGVSKPAGLYIDHTTNFPAAREAEMTEALGAEKGERTAGRLGFRSGYYGRTLIFWRRACHGPDGRAPLGGPLAPFTTSALTSIAPDLPRQRIW